DSGTFSFLSCLRVGDTGLTWLDPQSQRVLPGHDLLSILGAHLGGILWGQPASSTQLEEGNLIPRYGFRSLHLKRTRATRAHKATCLGRRERRASVSAFIRDPTPEGAAGHWPSGHSLGILWPPQPLTSKS
ncbi:mCG146130, partial [Mus musculus]